MTLVRCAPAVARVIESEPPIETCFGALYVPAASDGWGLYDYGDRVVVSAARWSDHDGSPQPQSGCWTTSVQPTAELDGDWVYAGLLEPGRTAFLADTLSRCWSRATFGTRLLFHARAPLEELFATPLIEATMAALGITRADCTVLDQPTRLGRVIVPAASFERGRLAHRAYARLAATVGIRLSGRIVPASLGRAPLHVSSAREDTPALAGEEVFDRGLAEEGVAVVHPSEMSFAALVARVRAAGLVSSTSPDGAAGVGCQASAFRDAGWRMVLCTGAPARDSVNVDAVCGHRTLYLRALRADPGLAAAAYARAMRRLIVVRRLPCDMTADGGRPDLGGEASACTTSDGQDGSILVGGLLTGTAQLVVSGTEYPWWQAEFARPVVLGEVRVHGPVDGDARASVLRLFGSFDGRDWSMLAEREDPSPIGGIDGAPHRFTPAEPWEMRFLRIQSESRTLVLDQVELLAPSGSLGRRAAEIDEVLA